MLTAPGCAVRRERLWEALPQACDFLIVGDPQHLIYFANYAQSPFVSRSADAGAMLVLEPGNSTLVGDNLVGPFLIGLMSTRSLLRPGTKGNGRPPNRRCHLVDATRDVLAGRLGRRIGVERASVPLGLVEGLRAARPGLELVDLDPIIRPLRRSKDPDEMAVLRQSIRAGEAGHAAALGRVEPGMTEHEAYLLVQQAAIETLGEPAIVYGDFVSGPRLETERGGPPSSRAIAPGDLLLLDFSVVVTGYRGDFTNTFAVGRGPTDGQREAVRGMRRGPGGRQSAVEAGHPGSRGRRLRARPLRRLGPRHRVPHPLGHRLGLGRPEPPSRPRQRRDPDRRRRRRAGAWVVRPGRRRDAVRAELPRHGRGMRHPHRACPPDRSVRPRAENDPSPARRVLRAPSVRPACSDRGPGSCRGAGLRFPIARISNRKCEI